MNNIGSLIRQKRKEKRLTLDEVATALNVSKSTVSKYERGLILNLKRSKMKVLCNLLDINPLFLITETEVIQEVTIDNFKVELNYLLDRVPQLEESEKDLIRNCADLICETKGK